jgi:hypothetical protein
VIVVLETTMTLVAGMPPTVTVVETVADPVTNPFPVMVIAVPPAVVPDIGVTVSPEVGVAVTMYCCVVTPSWAVTVYVTGLVKFWATPEAGEIVAPLERVMVGAILVRLVPYGTIRDMVLLELLMSPVTTGLVRLNWVMRGEDLVVVTV